MVDGSTIETEPIVVNPAFTTVLPGTMLRSSVALTSSAVIGVPSWNFTPCLSVKSHVMSLTCFHDVARPGWSLSVLSHRVSVS